MKKMYLCSQGRMDNFIKVMMVLVVMGFGGEVRGQVAGDFQPKNATGFWSDFNSWNVRNATGWIPAIAGQLPNSTTSVFQKANSTIIVDDIFAVCNDLIFPNSNSSKIEFSANSILSLHGDLDFGQTASNIFSGWGIGAKLICTGNTPQSFSNNLNPNHKFIFLEINKSSSSLSFPIQNASFENITLTSGAVIMNSGDLRGSATATLNINGGTWTQITGANRINGGSGGTDLFAININAGSMTLATTSMGIAGYNLGSVNITNGGILNLTNFSGNIGITNAFFVDAISTLNTAMVNTPTSLNNNFQGTVNYNHTAAQNIINTNYGSLGLLGGGTKTTSSTLNISRNLNISGTAILPLSASIGVNIGGNWTNYNEVGLTESTSTVDFNGVGSQTVNTVGGENFFLIKKTGTGTLTLNSNVTATGGAGSGLNISLGIVDAGTNTFSGAGTSTLTMSGGILKLGKLNTTLPEFTGTYALGAGTIELNGSGSQILRAGITSYRNLTFSGSSFATLSSTSTTGIIGTVYITGSAQLDLEASNTFGNGSTNLTMDGGRLKMAGNSTDKPDIDGNYNLTGGILEFAGSGVGAQPIKGQTAGGKTNIIYKNIEVTGTNVGTGAYNIYLSQAAGSFTVKSPNGVYAPNTKSIISENNINTSSVIIENGGTFKIGNNQGFSGTKYTVVSNSAIDNNISTSRILLNSGSTVDYAGASAQFISNQIPYQNFSISANSPINKTAPGSMGGDLIILGNIFKGTGAVFVHNNGRVSLEGTAIQNYISTDAGMEFYTLLNKNTTGTGFTVNSNLGIVNQLKLEAIAGSPTKLTFGNGNINLRSTLSQTANIPNLGTTNLPIINYSGSGRFQIERYLFAQKSWRFLSVPLLKLADDVSSPTINDSWREGATTLLSSSYGTRITGPKGTINPTTASPNKEDEYTQRASMKYYDMASNNYVEIKNVDLSANKTLANDQGYYIFVRGDRSISVPSSSIGITILRAKGKIRTGDQTFIVNEGKFQSVGNPFPSRLKFLNVTKTGGTEDAFTIWNPTNLGGGFGVGRFEQYVNNTLGTYVGAFGTRDYIESGEAFFISAITANGSIIIKEGDKFEGSANLSRVGVTNPTFEINLFAKANDNSDYKADGTLLNFDPLFSNSLNNEDVKKFTNVSDNISILNGDRKFFLERRSTLTSNDTIFLSLTNTRIAPYRFEIDPSVLGNLPLNAYLKDKYLGTETSVSLTGVTNVNFSITNDAASQVADRFMIVFKQAIPNGQLTGNFISIAVNKNADKTNILKWSYSNELNIAQYSIERSKNGTAFTGVGNQNAENVSNTKSYIFIDAANGIGTNYYRVKATSTIGQVQYSNTVKIIELNVTPVFAVWPNPIENKTMRISFENLEGNYSLKLVAKQGGTVYIAQITVSSAKEVKNIAIGKGVAAGFYDLVLLDKAGKSLVQTVVVQ